MAFWDTFEIQTIKPFQSAKSMDFGERRIHRISNSSNYVIIEKFTGTALKLFLDKLSYMMNYMPENHKYFIIHKSKHPFFFDPIPCELFFSDSEEYALAHGVPRTSIIGPVKVCIDDTFDYLKCSQLEGCEAPKNEYYMIIASGTNKFDCSEKYIRTRDLNGSELRVRLAQKRIIADIVFDNLPPFSKVANFLETYTIQLFENYKNVEISVFALMLGLGLFLANALHFSI